MLALLPLVLACEQPGRPQEAETPRLPDWEPTSLTDPVTHLAISAPATAEAAGGREAGPSAVLYALTRPQGTGESALWRSDDAGATWQVLKLPTRRVSDLAVNPREPRFVYVAGAEGVHRSPDGGATWLLTLKDRDGLRVAVSRADPTLLYAATGQSSSAATWRSSDRGETWELIRRLQGSLCVWTFPVISPHSDVRDRVYVSYYCAAGRTSSAPLSRSDDRWSTTGEILTGTFRQGEIRGFLFPEAARFASDGERGIVLARRGPFRASVLLRTDDGGRDWSALLEYPALAGYVPNVVASGLHVEQPAAERILLGLGGDARGVIGSEDGGRSFGPVGARPIGRVSALATDPATGRLYAGTDRGLWQMEPPWLRLAPLSGPVYAPWAAQIATVLGGGAKTLEEGTARGPDLRLSGPYGLAWDQEKGLLVSSGRQLTRLRRDGTAERVKVAAPTSVGILATTGEGWVVYAPERSVYSAPRSVEALSPSGEVYWVAGFRAPQMARSYTRRAPEASLSEVAGVAADAAGAIYLADSGARVVWKIERDGAARVVAGSGRAGRSGDRLPATEADLEEPWALALDREERLIIVDRAGQRVVRVEGDGRLVTIAGSGLMGYADDGGPAVAARLAFPSSATVDGAGRVYIADALNHAVRVVDVDGRIWTLAGTGSAGQAEDGPASGARLNLPLSLAWDGGSGVYVADYGNNRVLWIGPMGSASP